MSTTSTWNNHSITKRIKKYQNQKVPVQPKQLGRGWRWRVLPRTIHHAALLHPGATMPTQGEGSERWGWMQYESHSIQCLLIWWQTIRRQIMWSDRERMQVGSGSNVHEVNWWVSAVIPGSEGKLGTAMPGWNNNLLPVGKEIVKKYSGSDRVAPHTSESDRTSEFRRGREQALEPGPTKRPEKVGGHQGECYGPGASVWGCVCFCVSFVCSHSLSLSHTITLHLSHPFSVCVKPRLLLNVQDCMSEY